MFIVLLLVGKKNVKNFFSSRNNKNKKEVTK